MNSKEIVICPFYKKKRNRENEIRCQGLYEGTDNAIGFKNETERITHSRRFCESFNYKNCKHAKRLMEEE